MIYKVTTLSKLLSLKWVVLFSVILIPPFFNYIPWDSPKKLPLFLAIAFVWSIFAIPQLYLIIQYFKVTNYKTFEIDMFSKKITITYQGKQIVKDFSEIKHIVYAKPHAPIYWGFLWLTLCTEFYYYRFDFENESYFLTSIVTPRPKIRADGDFYYVYAENKMLYAHIKKRVA